MLFKIATMEGMYEYSQLILEKVSENKDLFQKELYKALQWIHPEERTPFKKWVYSNYIHLYPETIHRVFNNYLSN